MSAIELRDVGVAHEDVDVLASVDLVVPSGTVMALLGASGSGKTSLLRVVAGLASPAEGTVALGGVDVTRERANERGLAYVPQGAPLLPNRDVARNLAFPLEVKGLGRPRAADEAARQGTRFGIGRLLRKRPTELSSGEKAEAGIAKGLVHPPRALLLDEPVPHLDPRTRARVLAMIRQFQREHGTTVLAATNDVHVVEALADTVAVIDDHTIVRTGTLAEVRAEPGTVLAADLVSPAPLRWIPGVLAPGVRHRDDVVETAAGSVVLDHPALRRHHGPVLLGVAGRGVVLTPPGTGSLTGRVTRVATTGARRLVTVATAAGDLSVDSEADRWIPGVDEPTDVDVRRAHVADMDGRVLAVVD